ncbi:IclR family transcriptional regulator [Leucobacter komagatae]|uniref:Glycerol operon regulatory protein n=1 Tax=Leucobacter komagatae TaxID=55969 RepID=A0A542Y8S4_9MICO|nr:helix-turn-helix domain-containing protein [Leucobacter komagatae]TQL44482.1 IclR family transcriptional regulator [Leucobacter komagatae]
MTGEAARGGSQTLARGIRILEALASSHRNLTIEELARSLDVHRSIAYRLLRTLEDHGLVVRDDAGKVGLGVGLTALASNVSRDLQTAALPHLDTVANELGVSCLLVVYLNSQEAMTLTSAAPHRHSGVVVYDPGFRHPLTRGAPGKAILSAMPRSAWPAEVPESLWEELEASRVAGFTSSTDEVIPSLHSIAVPLSVPGQPQAAVAVVHMSFAEPDELVAARLRRAADGIRADLGLGRRFS